MSNYPGMGVLIRMLSGNEESVAAFKAAIGKRIASVTVDNGCHPHELRIMFTDETGLVFEDRGQSCCESRYMVCDDDLSGFVGAELINAELRDGDSVGNDWGGEHEVQFLAVITSAGEIVVSNHNEHNGYYGGFSIEARAIAAERCQVTPRDVLVKARELLAEPARWTKETAARDAAGLPVGATSDAAVCWCLIGALDRVRDGTTALKLLRRTIGGPSISAWNDDPARTHAEVLALLDRAIAEEEAACASS